MKRFYSLYLIISLPFFTSESFAQGKPIEQYTNTDIKIQKNDKHSYLIPLTNGEYAGLTVFQKGVDIAIDLISPSGKKLQTFDSPNGTDGPEPISIIATETGNYQIQIYPMIDNQSSISDSSSKTLFIEQNQGNYRIIEFIKLTETQYQQKLASEAKDKEAFTHWLSTNSYVINSVDAGTGFNDLKPFKQILKGVTVLGLGEASHGTSEFFRMKHRMLEFLVKEMGYTSFYIEASMSRCRYINDYVLSGKGNLDTATVIQGFVTWRVEEVRSMIEWIRNYNKLVPEEKKVKFLGYDLQINDFAWKDLQKFYSEVNPTLNHFIDSLIKQTTRAAWLSNGNATQENEGRKLFETARKSCIDILTDLILKEGQYEYASSKLVYQQNLMNIKLIIQEIESFKDGLNDRRDYYMAQNILTLLNNEKKDAKVVVWAHNMHIEKSFVQNYSSMGYFLSQSLKDSYYALGFEFYKGAFQTRNYDLNNHSKNWDVVSIGAPPVSSLPWFLNSTGKAKLYVNLRSAQVKKYSTFNQTIEMHSFGSGYSPKYGKETFADKLENFDGLIFINESTAAKNFTKVSLN
jgi:erythromycin esterase